jgi:hypothetical protein
MVSKSIALISGPGIYGRGPPLLIRGSGESEVDLSQTTWGRESTIPVNLLLSGKTLSQWLISAHTLLAETLWLQLVPVVHQRKERVFTNPLFSRKKPRILSLYGIKSWGISI